VIEELGHISCDLARITAQMAAICKFSITVMEGKTRRPSGQWATPSCRMRRAEALVMSSPSKMSRPPAGVTSPEIALSVVVLPAPFAPISVTSSPL
jgi:hypothetical protein